MKKILLSIAIVGLMASASMGAPYMVKQAAWAPTGPADSVWTQANAMTTTGDGDLSFDARWLWDGNYLYARCVVTDNQHSMTGTVDKGNFWNMDIVEFMLNPTNATQTSFATNPGSDQLVWGINNVNALIRSNTQISASYAAQAANVVLDETYANWDYTGANAVGAGNYAIQVRWSWTDTTANGGLARTAPTALDLLRLSMQVDDRDGADGNTQYPAGGSFVWNDPSTYAAAQLDSAVAPEPATMTLLVLGGIGLLAARKRRR
jgi:hypothetical protein